MRFLLPALLFCVGVPAFAGLILIPDSPPLLGLPGDQIELTVVELGVVDGVAGSKIYGSYDGPSGTAYLQASRCADPESCSVIPEPPTGGVGAYDGSMVYFHYAFTVTFDIESQDDFGFLFTLRLDDRDPVTLASGGHLAPGSYEGTGSYQIPNLGGAVLSNWFLEGTIYAMPPAGQEYRTSRYMGIEIPPNSIDLTGAAVPSSPVPEPATWMMAAFGLAAVSWGRRNRR